MSRSLMFKRIWQSIICGMFVVTLFLGSSADVVQASSMGLNAPTAFNKTSPAKSAVNQATDVVLTWSASSGVTKYEYCVDATNDSKCSTSWVNAGLKTSVTVKGLSAGTIYYWQVRAVNSAGTVYANGKLDYFWKFTTGTAPRTFNKKAVPNSSVFQQKQLTLSWGSSSNAVRYEYCIDLSSNGKCDTTWVSTGLKTSVVLTNLKANTTYSWQVRAVNTAGIVYANGDSSSYWTFKTGGKADFDKKYPTNSAANVPVNVTLKWGPKEPYTTYEYCIDTSNDKACSTGWVNVGSATSVTLTLSASTRYYWQVRGTNSWGTDYANGSKTSYFTFKTQ